MSSGVRNAGPLTILSIVVVCAFLIWDFSRAGDDTSGGAGVHVITTNYGAVISDYGTGSTQVTPAASPPSP